MDKSNTNYMVKPVGGTYAVLDTAANVLVVFNGAVLGKETKPRRWQKRTVIC